MRVLHSIPELAETGRPVVLAAGVFDGMHLGHVAVVEAACQSARDLDAEPVLLTFEPHPAVVIRPDLAPPLLTTTPEKLRLAERLGIRFALVIPFTTDFAAWTAHEFIQALCAPANRLAGLCVGDNWTYGKDREGNVRTLRIAGMKSGFFTQVVSSVALHGERVSSTAIRQALRDGDLERAASFLGRPFTLSGEVVHGDGRGRQLGFPTANLALAPRLLPADGVYAVRAGVDHPVHPAVCNIGLRPTVASDARRQLEVHLLSWSGDLYAQDLKVAFCHRIRSERRFSSVDDLRQAIAGDIRVAESFFAVQVMGE